MMAIEDMLRDRGKDIKVRMEWVKKFSATHQVVVFTSGSPSEPYSDFPHVVIPWLVLDSCHSYEDLEATALKIMKQSQR